MSIDGPEPNRYMGVALRTLLENSDLLHPPAPKNSNKGDEKKDDKWEEVFDATAAFLGPTLWDKTVPYDADFKMEYMDLDEFLSENGIAVPPTNGDQAHSKHLSQGHHILSQAQVQARSQSQTHSPAQPKHISHQPPPMPSPTSLQPLPIPREVASPEDKKPLDVVKPDKSDEMKEEPDEYKIENCRGRRCRNAGSSCVVVEYKPFSPADLALANGPGQETFDPRIHNFTDEDLKPQPMVKKSKKQSSNQFVPDDLKDDKYWVRRRKNNMAAKRSRDARRIKENQIAMRASYLEKENTSLKKEMDKLRSENLSLKEKLAKYEGC